MLNELMLMRRGMEAADMDMPERHPEFRAAGRYPTLRVFLDAAGVVTNVAPIPMDRIRRRPLWKLTEGQKRSFPFVRPKPLWSDAAIRLFRERLPKGSSITDQRQLLLEIAGAAELRQIKLGEWASKGNREKLTRLRNDLQPLNETDASAVYAALDRSLIALEGGGSTLIEQVAPKLISLLRESADEEIVELSRSLLIESDQKGGGLFFDADGPFPYDTSSPVVEGLVCEVLRQRDLDAARRSERRSGVCGVVGGTHRVLVSGVFSQPKLPALNQTYLFARNSDIPASSRYSMSSAKSMDVAYETDIHARAALEVLTASDREGVTWRKIPGERPKQTDLLLAFVEAAPEAAVAGALADDSFDDSMYPDDDAGGGSVEDQGGTDSVAAFETQTQRLIEAVRAKASDLTQTPVRFAVLRQLDPGNRKSIYGGEMSVRQIQTAAEAWRDGERSLPGWLTLPLFAKAERTPRAASPPHVAPLGMIAFSRSMFVRGGTQRQEAVGLPASEAFALFLDPPDDRRSEQRAERVLRLVLARRTALVAGTAHALRPEIKPAKTYNLWEALRTATVLGVLLHKLGRDKETYMNDAAFKLGQLLAVADQVHAGYCADVRGGDVPPSLLGNQVFTMAQTAPAKALATLCRRWKPYDGWAKRAARDRKRSDELVNSKYELEQQRGWDIRKARSQARRLKPLAEELAAGLHDVAVTDCFRAELLLGYMAGLPAEQRDDENNTDKEHDNG